jgi:hypothetical protein
MTWLKTIPKSYFFFTGIVIAFFSLFIIVELNNNKLWTNDFKVYYDATIDYFHGKNPYSKNYGLDTGFFKYPPFSLYLFKIYTYFGYNISQLVHLFLLMLSLLFSIFTLKKIALNSFQFKNSSNQTWILFLTFLTIAIHSVREFHMGNINLFLLFFLVQGMKNFQLEKPFKTALYWSIMLILKPIMILSVIPLIFYKKWKIIGFMSGFGLLFFIFPIIHSGLYGNIILWSNWLKAVTNHGEYIVSENSLTYLSNYYLSFKSEWLPSLVCLFILLSLLFYKIFKKKTFENELIIWVAILTAFSPNFFVTDTEHFLLIIPLIVYLLYLLSKVKSVIGWIGFSIGMILFSFNSNDLWGREISDNFDAHGVLGIGNICFILTFIYVWKQTDNKTEIEETSIS